jgi:hypothetical protein
VVDVNHSYYDKPEIKLCQKCKDVGVRSVLGARIYQPNEFGEVIIPADVDEWRQCHTCWKIYPVYGVKGEGELTVHEAFELVESRSDFGKGIIEGLHDSRKVDRSPFQWEARKKQHNKRYADDLDPEVRVDLEGGATLESYSITKGS